MTDKDTPQADNALLIDLANAVTREEYSPMFACRESYRLGVMHGRVQQA